MSFDLSEISYPTLMLIISILLLLLGAFGRIDTKWFKVAPSAWARALVIGIGVLLLIFSIILFREDRTKQGTMLYTKSQGEISSCTNYGIRITSPQQGASLVGEEFEVSGSYMIEPPEESLLLIYVSPDGRNYWPQFIVETDPARKTWKGEFLIGGNNLAVADIMVAIMGETGRTLFDYFMKVGEETGQWPAIEKLTDDIVECDRITVVRTNSSAPARTLATSTFDHNDEGWQAVNNEGSGPVHFPSGGNPDGYISTEDAKSASPWYWSAPAKFLGDKSDAYGGELNFDLRQSGTDNQSQDSVDIILVGGGIMLEFYTSYNPDTLWTKYSIRLDESAGWMIKGNNKPATSADLKKVLKSLTELKILGDYQIGASNCDLDNVVLLGRK